MNFAAAAFYFVVLSFLSATDSATTGILKMGKGRGRYTSMGSFGPPPMFFSLLMFSWLKPKYVFPKGGGPGPPPTKSRPSRIRYRSQDPFDLSLDTRESRRRRAIPPTEGLFMHMARSLDDLEDEQMRNAMENSENDMGGVDKKAMVSKAIIHLKTENIVAEPSKVTVNAMGNCLPDTIIVSMEPDIEEDHLKRASRNLRLESVTKMCKAIQNATKTQLKKLADLSTGRLGAGRQESKEGLVSLLQKFGSDYEYMGEGGDLFTCLIAYALRRPIIIVDVHQDRDPTFTVLHHDLVFMNKQPPDSPFVIVRSGDHYEPLLIPEGQEATLWRLYNKLRAADFQGTESEETDTEENTQAEDSDVSLPSPDRVANLWRYGSSPKQRDRTQRASLGEGRDGDGDVSELEVLSSDDSGKETIETLLFTFLHFHTLSNYDTSTLLHFHILSHFQTITLYQAFTISHLCTFTFVKSFKKLAKVANICPHLAPLGVNFVHTISYHIFF